MPGAHLTDNLQAPSKFAKASAKPLLSDALSRVGENASDDPRKCPLPASRLRRALCFFLVAKGLPVDSVSLQSFLNTGKHMQIDQLLPHAVSLPGYGAPDQKSASFKGADIRCAEDLPRYLLAGDLESFTPVIHEGEKETTHGWEAAWANKSGFRFELSWGTCWRSRLARGEDTLFYGGADGTLPFDKALYLMAAGMRNSCEKAAATLPVLFLNPAGHAMIGLPDGYISELLIPVPMRRLREAADTVKALGERMPGIRNARFRLVLGRQTRESPADPDTWFSAVIRKNYEATGIVCSWVPILEGGKLHEHCYSYYLCVMSPLVEVPELLRHLLPLKVKSEAFPALLFPAGTTARGWKVEHRAANCDFAWYFDQQWRDPFDASDYPADEKLFKEIDALCRMQDAFAEDFLGAGATQAAPGTETMVRLCEPEELDGSAMIDEPEDGRQFRVLVGSTIMNPFGPTLALIGTFADEEADGEFVPLHELFFHPTSFGWVHVGEIRFGERLTIDAAETLGELWNDFRFGMIFPGTDLAKRDVEPLVRGMCKGHEEDIAKYLQLMQEFPEDIYSRFDVLMGEKPFTGKPTAPEDSVNSVLFWLQYPEDMCREFENFLSNWRECELYFLRWPARHPLWQVKAFLTENAGTSFKYLED